MEEIFKLVGRFFPDRFRETKEQKAFVEQTLLLSQVSYPGAGYAAGIWYAVTGTSIGGGILLTPTDIRNWINNH
jgi:hypothetical protein